MGSASSVSKPKPQPFKYLNQQTQLNELTQLNQKTQLKELTQLNQQPQPNEISIQSLINDRATDIKSLIEQVPIPEPDSIIKTSVHKNKSVGEGGSLDSSASASSKKTLSNKESSKKFGSAHESISQNKQEQHIMPLGSTEPAKFENNVGDIKNKISQDDIKPNIVKKKRVKDHESIRIKKLDIKKLLQNFGCNISNLDESEFTQKLDNFLKNIPRQQLNSGSKVASIQSQESSSKKSTLVPGSVSQKKQKKKVSDPSQVEYVDFGDFDGVVEIINNQDIEFEIEVGNNFQYDESIPIKRQINPYWKYKQMQSKAIYILSPNITQKIQKNNNSQPSNKQSSNQNQNQNQESSVEPYNISSQSDHPNINIKQTKTTQKNKNNKQNVISPLLAHCSSLKYLGNQANNPEQENITNCIRRSLYCMKQDGVIV